MTDKCTIERIEISQTNCLQFKFEGKFTKRVAQEASAEWTAIFEADKSGGIIFIWDCSQMNGWTSSARVLWQKTTRHYRQRIARIYLITDSIKIKAGAQLITTFTSYPIKIVRTRREVEEILKK